MINKQSLKIVLAAVVVMFATNFLTSCDSQESLPIGVQRLEMVQEFKKTVSMELIDLSNEEGEVNIRIILKNPENSEITSAQTWFSFNPAVLEGLSISTDESDFDFTAPYDQDFDQATGLVMIGRSSADPLSDAEIVVADISFKKVGDGAVMIESYDYKQDLSGHTSVNMVDGETPYNLLLKPKSPLFTTNK